MFKFVEDIFAKNKEKKDMRLALNRLLEESAVTKKFILFTIISSMMATLGIIMNNSSILIGAMLIAPLLIPLISLSVGIGAGSVKLIGHSLKSLSIGLVLSFTSAVLVTVLVKPDGINTEIYETFSNSLLYGIVAILAGITGVYSWFKSDSSQVIPGVAIAVALVPPIAFLGTVVALNVETVLVDTVQLIAVNFLGIFIGGLLTFIVFALLSKRPTAEVGKQIDSEVKKK
jgi:uncharacterized hydrophobic protein (TIGR00271 family)